jgi:hypothetical protein
LFSFSDKPQLSFADTTQLEIRGKLVAAGGAGHQNPADALGEAQLLPAFRTLFLGMFGHDWAETPW